METTTEKTNSYEIIGESKKLKELFETIDAVADDAEGTVLLLGKSGTGKELVAKAIHQRSPQITGEFVPVNCAAIPEELLESELFGYAKGAFTGATSSRMGRFKFAHNGTIFLDEIGDMKPSLQAKLLRVLQEKEFYPVGQVNPVKVNCRVIAATHVDLEKAVAAGRFREDLYYRLNVLPIDIPTLKERRSDIPLLVEHFAKKFAKNTKNPLQGFSVDTMACLSNYNWPGNVRELENLIQRLNILCRGQIVEVKDLPAKIQSAHNKPATVINLDEELFIEDPAAELEGLDLESSDIDLNEKIGIIEDRIVLQALAYSKGDRKLAAKKLMLKTTGLAYKIKRRNLDRFLPKEWRTNKSDQEQEDVEQAPKSTDQQGLFSS